MKQKPWSLIVLSVLHILAPIGNLFLNAIWSGRSLSVQWDYWAYVIPVPLLFIYVAVPILAGIFIYLCRRWSYWAYLGCLAIIFASNIFSFWTQFGWTPLFILVFILVMDILVVAYFVVPSVQRIYMNPKLRWWEAAPRFHLNVEGTANSDKCFIKNLGQGGLLISGGPVFKEGDLINNAFTYKDQLVRVAGCVVYVGNQQAVPTYGVKFHHTAETQQVVRKVIQDLEKEGKIVRERMPGPEDGFFVWLKKILTTGKGLFPSVR